jgi:hypothetical protein
MKTKKTALIFAGILLYVSSAVSQTYYYNTTQTFYESGYTYRCDSNSDAGFVTLYNICNQYMYSGPTYKNGSPVSQDFWDSFPKLTERDNWTKDTCYSIVNNAFSAAEKQRIQGKKLSVTMRIDSETGAVLEVDFWFRTNSPFATIPVSVYRSIETGIKSSVWFTPTELGRSLNYIMRAWRHEVE